MRQFADFAAQFADFVVTLHLAGKKYFTKAGGRVILLFKEK